MSFQLFDTAQRAKRTFEPITSGKVSIYVCGLTVYDLPHIGHARTFITFDVVRRYFTERGYDVHFIRNHTDVDDKIIRRAAELGEAPEVLAERMINGLNDDMAALGVLRADVEPRVTTHIPQIVAMINTLIERGHAYAVDGDVYFRVESFEGYGGFSGRNLEDLESGARVETNQLKETPFDFALWKNVKPGEPSWETPWGSGRPGWHIECSAMSTEYLGATFDIHGGGRDLIFPHHENEIAQSKASCGGEFARYWMHTGMLEIEGEKMSHSLDNFWTVRDILKQVHPDALRYFFLTASYRNNINFSRETIHEAARRVTYLYRTLEALGEAIARGKGEVSLEGDAERAQAIAELLPSFHAAMEDDFNTPRALATIAEAARLANEFAEQRKKPPEGRVRSMKRLQAALSEMGRSVGLLLRDPSQALAELTALEVERRGLDVTKIEALIEARTAARAEKNWAEADRIRDELVAMDVQILDRPEGTAWRIE